MRRSSPVDGFHLAYDQIGSGPPVVLLHGWPGDRTDFRSLIPLMADVACVVAPDLRGFGESDKHEVPPADAYSAAAQARSVAALIEEVGLNRPVLAGYDVGSRVARTVALTRPDLVSALIISPPLPGIGTRVFSTEAQREFWYQSFHQLDLARQLIDGQPAVVGTYLEHFWSHWSGPTFALDDAALNHLVDMYGAPGAFTASIGWYRAGSGTVATSAAERAPRRDARVSTPTTVLWPTHDPLFPVAWADRLEEFFTTIKVHVLDGVGHFTPLEAPQAFASAIAERLHMQP